MGRNFYRVIHIERTFSFSVNGAQEVYDWLSEHDFVDALNNQGSGFVDVPVESLEQMLEEVMVTDASVLKCIQDDIVLARKNKIEFLTYEVF